ncbi:MAG: hypothetical protein ABI870_01500, partial [Rhodanobacter sp.]
MEASEYAPMPAMAGTQQDKLRGSDAASTLPRKPDRPAAQPPELAEAAGAFMESCFIESCFIESCFMESGFMESC